MSLRGAAWAALAVALVAVRAAWLGDYPALNPDEGFWASGARNWVRYGDAFLDRRLHPLLSPAHFAALCGYFSLVPPDLWSARLFSALAGLLSCAVVAWLARRLFPRRPWLWLLLFGLGSLAVLVQRVALLEAHQTLWLVLAAALWLSGGRRGALLAGAAYAAALLVKSNSLYLLPAFLLSPPERPAARSGLALFLAPCVLLTAAGYGAAWASNPAGFATAFRYELDGRHFLDEGVLFHVGRFGAHPRRALTAARGLAVGAPLVLPLAAAGAMLVLRRPRAATRADRLFTAWALFGLAFHFGQIYVEQRYLTTLAPALTYLAALALDRLLAASPAVRWPRVVVAGLLVLFVAYHLGRLGVGVRRRPNEGYWRAVAWVRANVSAEANVLAAPAVGLSLPQRTYDFFRAVRPYGREAAPDPLAAAVERDGISVLVVDPEWRAYLADLPGPYGMEDTARFIATRCRLRASVDGFDVYLVRGREAEAGQGPPGPTVSRRPRARPASWRHTPPHRE
jgi:4-amino-4-deoxy-L-arabinose transferase-like glycosyltransferase